MGFTADDRIPLFGSLSHGQGISTMWGGLLNGATIFPFHMASRGVTGLQAWMIEHGITVYISSASVFRNFMKTLPSGAKLPSVHAVRLASEPATADEFRQFQEHFPANSIFVHTLASSETSNIAVSRWSHDASVPEGRLPVGILTKGHQVLFLDQSGSPVPRGEVGEIVIKSRYIAAGYWRNPALTAERFSDAADGSGDRIFRTGDLCRIDSDGTLQFFGRKDSRIKIRGNRIELSEIEDELRRLSGVKEAVIDAIERPNQEAALVGYVVASDDFSWSPARLRRALRAVLPDHMVPSMLIKLDRVPLTPAGKVNREILRQSLPRRGIDAEDQPQTATEALLADLWSESFELPGIARHDDFFDLGGDSLIAAVVAARVHAELEVQLNLSVFAYHPTLAELAGIIDKMKQTRAIENKPKLTSSPRNGPLPLSFYQERIWMFSQTPDQSAAYTMSRGYRIVGQLDVEVLRHCMNYIARRHEMLRTTFADVGGRPVQIVHPPEPVSFRFLDLAGNDDANELAIAEYRKEATRVFDLTHAPLVQFLLIRVRPNEHWLLNAHHHIISDGWSWRLYNDELALLYEASIGGATTPLPDIEPLQYGDYAAWQRNALRSDSAAYREAIAWWKARFADNMSTCELPFKRDEPASGVDPGDGTITSGFELAATRRLDDLARNEGATYYLVRLAAFAALLAAEIGMQDVIVGTYVQNRNRTVLQNMFGFFGNLITLRLHCESGKTFREWLSDVCCRMNETELYSELPYEELRRELLQQGVTLPEIRVILHRTTDQPEVRFAGLTLTKLERTDANMPWGFTMEVDQRQEEQACRALFDARLYDPAGVRGFMLGFRRMLDAVSRYPDKTLEELLAMSRSHGAMMR
jgi:Condensation domain/AMP-binding enzyme/Phosphopantetheine attachment site/AMP-binding enzyme C-terminal domain